MRNELFSSRMMPRRRFLELGLKSGIAIAVTPPLLSTVIPDSGPLVDQPAALEVEKAMLDRVILRALRQGGQFADIYLEHRHSRQIIMEESKLESGSYGISQGAGVRVISGDRTGYAYTEEVTEENLMRAADIASYVARNGHRTDPVNVSTAERDSFVTVKVPLEHISDTQRIEVMERANQAALDYDGRIRMAKIEYNDQVRGRVIANSEGVYLRDELPQLFFIVETMSDDGTNRHMSRQRIGAHSGFELFDEESPESVARRAARESIVMLDAEDAPAGTMDVVMENGFGGVLIHEAVGHPLEADNIAKGIGAFTGKVGQKVATDVFTMVDDGTLPNFRGTINFDDEGTQAQRNVLIDKGVLKGYMTDILSSRQLDLSRTGNGRRESFRHYPIPRMTNTFIEPGQDSPGDILADTKTGLYVGSLSGGSVNPVTGVFNFTCREAYLIENGQKTKPVKGATLIGSCMGVISSIDAVANDLAFGPGICGKGQMAEVTAGQPTVRIRGINVGGSRG